MRFPLSFKSPNRGFVVQGFQQQVFVVQPNISMRSLFRALRAVEAMRPQHLLQAAIQAAQSCHWSCAFRAGQSLLNAQRTVERIELMFAASILGAVHRQRPDLERCGFGHCIQERSDCLCGRFALDGAPVARQPCPTPRRSVPALNRPGQTVIASVSSNAICAQRWPQASPCSSTSLCFMAITTPRSRPPQYLPCSVRWASGTLARPNAQLVSTKPRDSESRM